MSSYETGERLLSTTEPSESDLTPFGRRHGRSICLSYLLLVVSYPLLAVKVFESGVQYSFFVLITSTFVLLALGLVFLAFKWRLALVLTVPVAAVFSVLLAVL